MNDVYRDPGLAVSADDGEHVKARDEIGKSGGADKGCECLRPLLVRSLLSPCSALPFRLGYAAHKA